MKRAVVVSVSGKGGVGKTTFTALTLKYLLDVASNLDILLVDADPDSNLPDVLGIDVKRTVGDVVNEVKDSKYDLPPDFDKKLYLEKQIFEILEEGRGFDLLVMGVTEREGCYCLVNSLLTTIVGMLLENYDVILMDMPAGLEHISRRTDRDVDILYILADGSKMSMQTVLRIKDLSEKLLTRFKKIFLVGNMVSSKLTSAFEKIAQSANITFAGIIPYDEIVAEYNFEGKPLLDVPINSKAYDATKSVIKRTLLPYLSV